MLKLRTPLPVSRHSSPIIRPLLVLMCPLIYHRLNREYMAWLHDPGGLVGRVVRNRGVAVEEFSDAVAAEGFVDGEGGCEV